MRFPLVLPPGINSDETTFAASGQYAAGSNVRPRGDKMQSIGGWTEAHATPLTGVCRNALAWLDSTTLSNIAFGTHSALMVLKEGTLANITPAGLNSGNIDRGEVGYGRGGYGTGGYGGGPLTEYYPRTWSFATWGQNLMANPRGKGLYIWTNNTAAVATRITQAPTNITCILVTPQRQVLAFGCSEETSGSFNAMCIRGSDFEVYTDWTTSSSNNAFEHILEGGGRIICARLFGSYIAVWTDTSVFLGTFIGDPGQTYRFDLIADNCGLAGPNAVTVVNQVAYWLTPDLQFYAWQLGAPPVPMGCTISGDFKANVSSYQIDKVVSTSVSEFNEIWWHYPDERDAADDEEPENSRYVAISLEKGVWFPGIMARTAAIDSGPERYPVMVDPDSMVFYHESGNDANGEALDWYLETSDFYLDEAQRRVVINGIWPDFEDQVGSVSLTLYTKSLPQAERKAKGPWALAPGREKRDFLFEARMAAVKLSGSAAGTFMRLGKPSFDVMPAGEW